MDRTNEFAFKIATANGTGSASANGLIMQAIFRMGVPVTGKNVFPSNIQGLPTWYEIRVNKHGYTARTPQFDLMVAMNPATYQKDIAGAQGRRLAPVRLDVAARFSGSCGPTSRTLGIPLAEMCNAQFEGVRERILMKNIAYAGALAALLNMDIEIIRTLLTGEVREEAGAHGFEPEGDRPRLRLREGTVRVSAADPSGGAGQDEGLDPDRRQHRGGAGLPVCRRDRRRVVSDHAGHVADGSVQRLLPEIPRRARDASRTGSRSSRRKTSWRRSAW